MYVHVFTRIKFIKPLIHRSRHYSNSYREIGDIREQWANNRRTKERYSKLLDTIANRISPYDMQVNVIEIKIN